MSPIDIDLIYELSSKEPKSIIERCVKLSEECGELAQEILIQNRASGFKQKLPGKDGIGGEAVDVLLVALSIYFKSGGSKEKLQEIVKKKALKWQANQEHKSV